MVRLGRVYRGLMVHMQPTNAKLRQRAAQMVGALTGCGEDAAAAAVSEADGDVKRAVLLALGVPAAQAAALLERHDGNLRAAIAEAAPRGVG
jgi:N-acetylmuramic acid 6-phosphate etherase